MLSIGRRRRRGDQLVLLARHLEADHGLGPRVAEQVAQRCGGNPLFAEHFASAAEVSGDDTRIDYRSQSTSSIPAGLQAMLAQSLTERLQQLEDPDRARRLIEVIAVLGHRAEVELVEALLEQERDAEQREVGQQPPARQRHAKQGRPRARLDEVAAAALTAKRQFVATAGDE